MSLSFPNENQFVEVFLLGGSVLFIVAIYFRVWRLAAIWLADISVDRMHQGCQLEAAATQPLDYSVMVGNLILR